MFYRQFLGCFKNIEYLLPCSFVGKTVRYFLIFRRKVSRCFDVISIKMSVCWYWWELFAFRFFIQKLSIIFLSPLYMRKKWPYLEFFRSVYPRILTELDEILRIPRWDAPYLSVFNLNEGKCGPEELRIRTLFTQWYLVKFWFFDY